MAWDFTVSLPNHPGTLAGAAAALGENDINIDGSCMVLCEDVGEFHVLIEGDAAAAGQALEAAGVDVRGQREVLVVEAEDRPGELGRLARRIADAGVNIELEYLATRTRIVIGAGDLDKARAEARQRRMPHDRSCAGCSVLDHQRRCLDCLLVGR